jgi:hypothetical protein
MRRPSDFLPSTLAGRLRGNAGLLGLGLLALALGEPMRAHSDALVTQAAPFGILSLQFACAADSARAILETWNAEALRHARLSLLWDMGFAPAYGVALAALSERLLAWRSRRRPAGPLPLAWLPLWAALADWLENLSHFCLLAPEGCGASAFLPTLACSFALLKWGLLSGWLLGMAGLGLHGCLGRGKKR